jgi:hypothetical protein
MSPLFYFPPFLSGVKVIALHYLQEIRSIHMTRAVLTNRATSATLLLAAFSSAALLTSSALSSTTALSSSFASPTSSAQKTDQVAKVSLKVGDPAPDFTLLSDQWKSVKLSDFRGKKNVFLAVYVLAFTGG